MPTAKFVLTLTLLGLTLSILGGVVLTRNQRVPAPNGTPFPTPPRDATSTPSHPTSIPANCRYQEVQCIKAPCDPVLVCDTEPSTEVNPTPPQTVSGCKIGGCSGQLCVEPADDGVTTCEYKAEYGCYQKATCERQPNGKCGWTATKEFTACLKNPPAL